MNGLSVLLDGHPWYNYMNATVAQGFLELGHKVYGLNSADNYCLPYHGESIDLVIQAWTKGSYRFTKPRIFLYGEDTHPTKDPCGYINFDQLKADAYFIRDFRGSERHNVYPMNFGIEKRYYCATNQVRKPLRERKYDVIFLGRWDNCLHRSKLLTEVRSKLIAEGYEVLIEQSRFSKPDDYWSQWVNGHCTHDPQYFEALADSKVILSPHGAGPDCARHWEALASGGVPLIQRMTTRMVPPGLTDGYDSLQFRSASEAIQCVKTVLNDLDSAQDIADAAFLQGQKLHTTKARAHYILSRIRNLIAYD